MQTAFIAGPARVAVRQRDGIVRSQTSLKMASSHCLTDRTVLKAFLGRCSALKLVGQCVIRTETACHLVFIPEEVYRQKGRLIKGCFKSVCLFPLIHIISLHVMNLHADLTSPSPWNDYGSLCLCRSGSFFCWEHPRPFLYKRRQGFILRFWMVCIQYHVQHP